MVLRKLWHESRPDNCAHSIDRCSRNNLVRGSHSDYTAPSYVLVGIACAVILVGDIEVTANRYHQCNVYVASIFW
jgi:hypothetical protein